MKKNHHLLAEKDQEETTKSAQEILRAFCLEHRNQYRRIVQRPNVLVRFR